VRKHFKIIAGSAATVGLSLTLATCGSGDGSNHEGGSGSETVTQAGQGARLSGTYSAADFNAWVPNDLYPSEITQSSDGLYSTGSTVAVNAKYSWSSMSCQVVTQESGGPGFGEEAYLVDQGQAGSGSATEDFTYGAHEFPAAAATADASAFVRGAEARYASCGSLCGSFSVADDGSSIPVTVSVGSAPDVPAANAVVDLRQKSAAYQGYQLVAEFVVAADGQRGGLRGVGFGDRVDSGAGVERRGRAEDLDRVRRRRGLRLRESGGGSDRADRGRGRRSGGPGRGRGGAGRWNSMTLRNIPVDPSRLTGPLCTSAPEVRADLVTGEARTDRTSGLPLYLVGVLVKVMGERKAYVLDVQVPGEPAGLVEGEPVPVEGLEAAPWERDGRSGVTYRASAIRPGPDVAVSAASDGPVSPVAAGAASGRPAVKGGGGS
jgi:hypothetical protein